MMPVVVDGGFIRCRTRSAPDEPCRWLNPDHLVDWLGASEVVVVDLGMVHAHPGPTRVANGHGGTGRADIGAVEAPTS